MITESGKKLCAHMYISICVKREYFGNGNIKNDFQFRLQHLEINSYRIFINKIQVEMYQRTNIINIFFRYNLGDT